jgi:peptide/nickel transport system ATP-binding protein
LVRALQHIDLTVQEGETLGVVGASGAGKSTLGLALAGLLPHEARLEGSVVLDGHELRRAADWFPWLGRGVTYVPQEPALALNPVRRAVSQVRAAARCALRLNRREADERARAALAGAGLESRLLQDAYPHELSGGQRQRVLLARAFLLQPRLVVADEPTSALDAVTQHAILALFERLRASGSAIVFITHAPHLVRRWTQRAVWIDNGSVAAAGAPAEVLAAGGWS